MKFSSRSRRFVPSVDRLSSRIVLSADVPSPMDPVLIDWSDGSAPPPVVTPMDPVLIGWSADGSGAGDPPPSWADSADSMGDMQATAP